MFASEHGDGPAVVLLHGQPGGAADWDLVVPRLDGFRVLVADRPGYGTNRDRARGFSGNADALAAALDERGIASTTVVGHSWGGGAALAFAHRFPERTHGAVLVAPVGSPLSVHVFDHVLGAPVVGDALAFAAIGLGARLVVGRAVDRELRHAPADARDAARRAHIHWTAAWRSFAIEQRALLRELPAITRSLATITAPSVVMIGTRDRIIPVRAAIDVANALPAGRLVVVPNAGHLLPFEQPDAIADAVRQVARPG
jgi:pimeloyl-ACP methyl ester carboxylesterase